MVPERVSVRYVSPTQIVVRDTFRESIGLSYPEEARVQRDTDTLLRVSWVTDNIPRSITQKILMHGGNKLKYNFSIERMTGKARLSWIKMGGGNSSASSAPISRGQCRKVAGT